MNNLDNFVKKLRNSGLRPTKQRIKICEVLFTPEKTFHFTISDLVKKIQSKAEKKISLATVYNTVRAFVNKSYLKEISINSKESYFDTNITAHHHFYDEDKNELIDINNNEVESFKIKKNIPGKKINSVEVLCRISEK